MAMRYLLIFLLFIGSLTHATAQTDEPLVQFSGLVMTSDSLIAIPYVNVFVKSSGIGTVANSRGFFTLVVHPGDTIIFSSVGYRRESYAVPPDLTDQRYSVIQLMTMDTINLAETVVYPWPSKEQFREAFLSLQVPDDQLETARKNLEREKLKEMGEQLPVDANESLDNYSRYQADKLYYYGQTPPMNIFSPLAWGQFIKAWKDGEFRKK